MIMTYLMPYVLCLKHLMYFHLMRGRVMLIYDSFALVGWTSTPKGGRLRIKPNMCSGKVKAVNAQSMLKPSTRQQGCRVCLHASTLIHRDHPPGGKDHLS